MISEVDTVVIGAGQAGLSAGYFLRRHEMDFVMLDHSPRAGGAWQFRWPTLTLGTTHRINDLPGMALEESDSSRPASEVVSEYFARYEREFELDVHRPVDVTSVREADATGGGGLEGGGLEGGGLEGGGLEGGGSGGSGLGDGGFGGDGGRLVVESSEGVYAARALINATGTWDRPFWPRYKGMETFGGRQLHTADYRGPQEFAGKRVLVVGGGASGVQALMEIAPVAAATTWVTRREPVWVEGPFDGRVAVARVAERVRRGLPPGSVVSATGLMLTPEVRAARESGVLRRFPIFERVTPEGVVWPDGRSAEFDVILWATGFRAALDHLAPLRLRGPGGGIAMDGTRVAADPRIHLLGYGPSASTIGANRAGRVAVREVRALLGRLDRSGVRGAIGA
ncbi:NAD(P)/FAD-dependent oxidoreductase [Actinomadura barringtoniae]|uniref:NAD(P)/FAD-dependent oxidoreductase n=1 Tax=Actinomadura barringtoniae TaxID=1427535 RepID=A0A939P6Q0_9ACTN|nr:NAD(P)-binding domain-containing protein [Actinomadura barringtoniae]MBO2446607.1 NAD(P)/FAD-dependent oxidoreductase [Actinomadura barringtoniae]